MDIEFHYYITYLLAIRAGFSNSDAAKIGYSAQFIDDNLDICLVRSESDTYLSCPTQIRNFKFSSAFYYSILLTYHFIPRRFNEKTRYYNKIATIAGAHNARESLIWALHSRNPYLIGIASHAFADTWAHQDFSGTWSLKNSRKFLNHLIPAIGHMHFGENPDLMGQIWNDNRLKHPIVDNYKRFMHSIAAMLILYMKSFNRLQGDILDTTKAFLNEISDIFRNSKGLSMERRMNHRIACYLRLLPTDALIYSPDYWLNLALVCGQKKCLKDYDIWQYQWNGPRKFHDWFHFQESAKSYKKRLSEIVQQSILCERFDVPEP